MLCIYYLIYSLKAPCEMRALLGCRIFSRSRTFKRRSLRFNQDLCGSDVPFVTEQGLWAWDEESFTWGLILGLTSSLFLNAFLICFWGSDTKSARKRWGRYLYAVIYRGLFLTEFSRSSGKGSLFAWKLHNTECAPLFTFTNYLVKSFSSLARFSTWLLQHCPIFIIKNLAWEHLS